MKKTRDKLKKFFYKYKYDFLCILVLSLLIILILHPLYKSGHVVFSDIDFGFSSKGYMDEIFGVWNERWSTSTLLNVARLMYTTPFYLLSIIFNYSGAVFFKSFLTGIVLTSGISMYVFGNKLINIYFSKGDNLVKKSILITGALYYAVNPWVITRIQHIYLLCGYSLFPLMLMFYLNAFYYRFEKIIIKDYDILSPKIYRRNIFDMFMLSIVFALSAAAIHYFFYGIIVILIINSFIFIKLFIDASIKRKYSFKAIVINFIAKLFIFIPIFICVNAYWLSMYVFSIVLKAQVSQHNVNVVDTFFLFAKYSSIKNILYLASYWWPMFNIQNLNLSFYIAGGVILAIILYAAVIKTRKRYLILCFTFLGVIFLIVSTGPNLDWFYSIFIGINNLPVIGSIFRDPNKMVALMICFFSVLLMFGVYSIAIIFEKYKYFKAFALSIVGLLLVSLLIYIYPFYVHYISGFYSPVKEPKEYSELQDKLKNKSNFASKVLYLPISDNMTQSKTGVSTPYWNVNGERYGMDKATGDIQVYSSSKSTIFQHEGNSVNIQYYINFLQYLMDRGLSQNIGKLISAFGVDQFVYHKEYDGQNERQNFNRKILDKDSSIKKIYENKITALYDVKNSLPYLSNVPKKIYTPYGFSKLESYNSIPNFNFKNLGVVFSSIDTKSYMDILNKGDYIEASSLDDILMCNLNKDDYLLPFDVVDSADGYMNWAKTLCQNGDWLWLLESKDINNFPFDFDFNSGVVYTFSTMKLNAPPNKVDRIEGKNIVDFKTLLKKNSFFVSENPRDYKIEADIRDKNSNAPEVKGQIAEGDSGNNWEVAKSGVLKARENNPYKFKINISGKNTNKMHLKAKFYDANMHEIYSSYIVKPSDSVDFESMDFTGECVSPPKTKYMRLEILSYKNPKHKIYWKIHDVNVYDLSEYKTSNSFVMNKKVKKAETAKVYIRALVSKSGGKLKVTVGKKSVYVDTFDDSKSQFKWIYLGKFHFDSGKNSIKVENNQGFNAINLFTVIPENEYNTVTKKIEKTADKCNIFCELEAENDFEYSGNIQSSRIYPKLSMGRAISSQDGALKSDIDVIKNGDYSFAINMNAFKGNSGYVTFQIQNLKDNSVIERKILSDEFSETKDNKNEVIDLDTLNSNFQYELKNIPDQMNYMKRVELKDIHLNKGRYTIKIKFNSNAPSLSNFNDMHKFRYNEQIDKKSDNKENTSNPSKEKINENMMNNRIDNGVFRIDVKATKSNDWYDYASKKIDVIPENEYLFQADVVSSFARNRHMKIVFMDKDTRVISATYISDIDERFKKEWNSYQQVVEVPKGAAYMQFHILCRGEEKNDGYIEMRNYNIYHYSELISIDNLIMFEGNNFDEFFPSKVERKKVKYSRVDSMKRNFYVDNPRKERLLINYIESPTPLWSLDLKGESTRGDLTLNGVTSGFIISKNGSGSVSVILRKIYYGSFIFEFLSIIMYIVLCRKVSTINKILEKIKVFINK
ncbi:membrane protein [Clostridium acetobutylicum]|nr:membrane protein [Clostridium acetobutylicum]